MNKKKFYIFFLILVLISSCSFDDKTGLWKGDKKEKERLSKLEKQQKEVINVKNNLYIRASTVTKDNYLAYSNPIWIEF